MLRNLGISLRKGNIFPLTREYLLHNSCDEKNNV